MGNLGRLVCAYCPLKDDMPFISGSYMIEVNDYIEKFWLIFYFQKAKKNGPHDLLSRDFVLFCGTNMIIHDASHLIAIQNNIYYMQIQERGLRLKLYKMRT